GVVVPLAGADEVLQGAALLAGLVGDRLGGLALQPGELAAEDRGGVGALLGAVEQRQVAVQEGGQVPAASADGSGADVGLVQQGLGVGGFQDGGHAYPPSGSPEG